MSWGLTYEINKRLVARGHKVYQITYKSSENQPSQEVMDRIQFCNRLAVSMVLVELKIAENLFRKINLKITALAATSLHICFTLLAILTLLRGIEMPNYGCFGVFWARPLTFITVAEDIFMVGGCVLLLKLLQRKKGQI